MFPTADVLALYRFRWQIELAFKRMKSFAGLDRLPAKKPELAQAWIYAKLIAVLIAEQIAGQVPDSPPYEPGTAGRKPITLAPHENGPREPARLPFVDPSMANPVQSLLPTPSLSL